MEDPAPCLERSISPSTWNNRPPAPADLKLYHFDIQVFGAPAEPVRLAFAVGDVPFEDVRLPRHGEEWRKIKEAGDIVPFRQFPVLQADGVIISQSNAILRYAGILAGLYPVKYPVHAAKVDQILGTIQDIKGRLTPSIYETNLEKKLAMRQKLATSVLPWWFKRLEASLTRNDETFKTTSCGFAVGDRLTIVDLALYCFLGWFSAGAFLGIPDTLLHDYPRLRKVLESVSAVPQVFLWQQAHPTAYFNESDFIDVSTVGQ